MPTANADAPTAAVSDQTLAVLPGLQRVTAFIGPFGSGKSELALAIAGLAGQDLARRGPQQCGFDRVQLADLDVLKPYFRSREAALGLLAQGVGLLQPPAALAASDLPILTAEMRAAIAEPTTRLILDVGGDPTGAKALGSLSDVMNAAPHDLLLVLNRNRPFMNSVDRVVDAAGRIAAAARVVLTGLVSNSHYLDDTTLQDVLGGLEFTRLVAAQLGLPVVMVGVTGSLLQELEALGELAGPLPPLLPVQRQLKPMFQGGVVFASQPAQP